MTDDDLPTGAAPQILSRGNGASIAYHRTPGRTPGVMFLTGFQSDMTGDKALTLEAACRTRGTAFLRFDYTGHGRSSGAFVDGCIGDWAADATDALDSLTEGPQVLVGSSMGGWIMLLVALARPGRVAGLVGSAAAPDFTVDLISRELSDDQKAILARDGRVDLPNPYDDDPTPITRRLIDDGTRHLLLRDTIGFDGPVRLIHGRCDADVPWETSFRIADRLRGGDVEVTLVKDGDHRLSRPQDLARLRRTVEAVLDALEGTERSPR